MKRELCRILFYWKIYFAEYKVNVTELAVANEYHDSRLLARKFKEWKTEFIIGKGLKKRIRALARGEEYSFSKNSVLQNAQNELRMIYKHFYQKLVPLKHKAFEMRNRFTHLYETMENSLFYPGSLKSFKSWVEVAREIGEHRGILEKKRKPLKIYKTLPILQPIPDQKEEISYTTNIEELYKVHLAYINSQKRTKKLELKHREPMSCQLEDDTMPNGYFFCKYKGYFIHDVKQQIKLSCVYLKRTTLLSASYHKQRAYKAAGFTKNLQDQLIAQQKFSLISRTLTDWKIAYTKK